MSLRTSANGRTSSPSTRKIHLVGGGIASMSAAAFMIRDGDCLGSNITIYEKLGVAGGSLDAAGLSTDGYVLRGGRMLESRYVCTFGLFDSIPTLDESRTVTEEIFAWNKTMKISSKSRLVRKGVRQVAPEFGLDEWQILALEALVLEPEMLLGDSSIADHFGPAFFGTDFWFMWCTTFAFQPWHSAAEFRRYLLRFAHMVGGFGRLEGIMRTTYNQYDSLVRPLQKWLLDRGVIFSTGARVDDVRIRDDDGYLYAREIYLERGGKFEAIAVAEDDLVIITLGSMTEASALGTMEMPAALAGTAPGPSFLLWEKIARGRREFGNPSAFDKRIEQSKWLSFTVTQTDEAFLHLVRDLTGNVPGEGGLVTFPESAWLASIVIPHQPHFIGQPEGTFVFWGYGLSIDAPGDFVRKPMSACTGREIMIEILGHLHAGTKAKAILETTNCIPCMMPYVTSQFLTRKDGDRPQVIPKGAENFAFVGQFCEIPEDVVFTVEYSIRSAQLATYGLLGLDRSPPAVYRGRFDPRVLFRAFLALHDVKA